MNALRLVPSMQTLGSKLLTTLELTWFFILLLFLSSPSLPTTLCWDGVFCAPALIYMPWIPWRRDNKINKHCLVETSSLHVSIMYWYELLHLPYVERTCFHLLIHFSKVCNSWGRAMSNARKWECHSCVHHRWYRRSTVMWAMITAFHGPHGQEVGTRSWSWE